MNNTTETAGLHLIERPTLKDFQDYVKQLEQQRGFNEQDALEKCLLLGEEIGELFKAVRKALKIKTDANSKLYLVEEELADILIYLCAIANRFDINIEQAFRKKEEVNKKREWKS